MKLFTTILQILPILGQNNMPGSQVDKHNCVVDGGYEWCKSSQSCERPWITPCLMNDDQLIDQLPMPLPKPLPKPIDSWGTRCSQVMCDLYCKNGMVLDSTGCPTCHCLELKRPYDPLTNNIPDNCASWNDGCNTCMVDKDGTIGGCTRMMCFTKNTPKCISYYSSH